MFSIAVFPRWVSVFLVNAVDLPDPEHLLQGSGKRARHIVVETLATLDRPAVKALMARAPERSPTPLDRTAARRIVIKSVSAKQRPRRPPPATSRPPRTRKRA
jgi:hypothetical protein